MEQNEIDAILKGMDVPETASEQTFAAYSK